MVDYQGAPVASQDIREGFTKMFWGLLFVVLDIRLNHIDLVLPDFLGYIIIALGLGMLLPLHQGFATARALALVMIPLSLTDLVEFQPPGHQGGEMTGWYLVSLLLTVVGTILNLLMIWHLCTGILEVAQSAEKHDLAVVARTRRDLYTVVSLVTLGLVLVGRMVPREAAFILIPVVILALIIMVLVMGLMLRASNQLADLGDPSHS